jgi:type VI secretion system protein ImpC
MDKNNSKKEEFAGLQIHEKIRARTPKESSEDAREDVAKKAFVVGVMGDFGSTSAAFKKEGTEKFTNIDRYNFDEVMTAMAPGCSIDVANFFQKGGTPFGLSLVFQGLKDFHPDNLIQKVPVLKKLFLARNKSGDPDTLEETLRAAGVHISTEESVPDQVQAPEAATPEPRAPQPIEADASGEDLLDAIIEQSSAETPKEREGRPSVVLDAFIREAVGPTPDRGDLAAQDGLRRKIDEMLENQVRTILSHRSFKRLEATWQSVYRLVREAETGPELKIKILDVSKLKILEDFSNSNEMEKTLLYRLIYENECDTPGGEPFGLLIGDYRFGPGSGDMILLEYLAAIASLSDTPFITAAAPSLLGLEDFKGLSRLDHLNHLEEEETYSAWRAFRQSDFAGKVGMCLPGILLRLPYGPDTDPINTFGFAESAKAKGPHDYLWGNPAMAFARMVTRAFAGDGWDMELQRYTTLSDLPVHVYEESGEKVANPCAEALLRETIVRQMLEAGFIPFVSVKNTDQVKIPVIQSVTRSRLFGH